jgi:predicted anti-sigma-YlaC factor YlaD
MNCKNYEKLIPRFLKKECTEKEEAVLLEHIRTCPECREEMTIQLLLAEGLNRLESGDSFDLNAELEKRLQSRVHEKKPRKKLLSPEMKVILADILTGAVIVAIVVGLLIWQIH